jgi:hypothetical protein
MTYVSARLGASGGRGNHPVRGAFMASVDYAMEEMPEAEACAVAEAIYTIENKLRAIYDSSG